MAHRTRASLARTEPSDSTSIEAGTTTRTRRSHKKSRNGCAECKHRHIRCDERQPSCANCEAAERTCSFVNSRVNKQKHRRDGRDHARQQQYEEETILVSPIANSEIFISVGKTDHASREHAELSIPVCLIPNDQSELPQMHDQLSYHVESTHDTLSFDAGLTPNLYKIPSPASPTVLENVATPPAHSCPGLSIIPDRVPKAVFTPQHMILMHYANTVPNFTGPNRSVVDIAVRHAIHSSYLLDEVLAFTAFHLASIYPGSASYLKNLATELQNRALASFTQLTKLVPNDDKATAVPRFLFSAILGRHVLADTISHCATDFRFFIDRFVECINLNRGIRAVTPPAWEYLHGSEIEPFIRVVREAEEKIVSPGHECDPLIRVLDDSDLKETSINACREAIKILQFCFDLCQGLAEDEYLQSASVFSVRIGADFIEVLRKHRPEALLILAYYGVLLFRCRNFWAFHDAGAAMIRAIAEQLGSYWQDALAWPLRVLKEAEHASESLAIPP